MWRRLTVIAIIASAAPAAADTVAGDVVDDKGAPVANARVMLSQRDGTRVTIETDARGHFERNGLTGAWEAEVGWRDETRWQESPRVRATGDLRLVLPSPASLRGRVLVDGVPAKRIAIGLSRDRLRTGSFQIIDAPDGRFALPALRDGLAAVTVIAPGSTRTLVEGVALAPGAAVDLGTLALHHGRRVAGRVRDVFGDPVAGAHVAIGARYPGDPLAQAFESYYETTTDAEGRYHLDGIAPIRDRFHAPMITVSAGAAHARPQRVPEAGGTVDLEVLVSGGIDGIVVGPRPPSIVANGVDYVNAQLDRDGGFHFDDLYPGTYELTSSVDHVVRATVVVAAGERTTVTVR